MCAHCTLALCCHKKPVSATICSTSPLCPFCRSSILELIVANIKTDSDVEVEIDSPSKPRRPRKSNYSEGSSSFKGLSAMSSFGRVSGHNSGKIVAECDEGVSKSWQVFAGIVHFEHCWFSSSWSCPEILEGRYWLRQGSSMCSKFIFLFVLSIPIGYIWE